MNNEINKRVGRQPAEQTADDNTEATKISDEEMTEVAGGKISTSDLAKTPMLIDN